MFSQGSFSFLNSNLQVQLPSSGARSVSTKNTTILQRVWKHKLISPNIKTFAWRLIRRAIATGARAGSLSSKINNNCTPCNMFFLKACLSTCFIKWKKESLQTPRIDTARSLIYPGVHITQIATAWQIRTVVLSNGCRDGVGRLTRGR